MNYDSEVCVIGAGPSGLFAVKHCLEYGLSVTCFEERPKIGGLWTGADPKFPTANRDGKTYTAVHDAVYLNTSQFVTSFSDFPLPDDLIPCLKNEGHFLSGPQFLDYLNRYANKFGVLERVVFSTEVVCVTKDSSRGYDDSSWLVTTRDKAGKDTTERTTRHRHVIVATGLYRKPHVPNVDGMDNTPVKWMHSGHVRFTKDVFQDKQVVIVGGSISAGDIAQAAVQAGAAKVTWAATRSPKGKSVCVVPRYPYKKEFAWDEWISHFGHQYFPDFVKQIQLESMLVWVHRRAPNVAADMNHDRFVIQDTNILEVAARKGRFATKSATVEKFFKDDAQVSLTNGEVEKADVCVFGTGYDLCYSFLDSSVIGKGGLAEMTLHRSTIALDSSAWGLKFLYTTPIEGSGIVTTEMEARWLVHQIACGNVSTEEQRLKLLKRTSENAQTFRKEKRRFTFDEISVMAADLGCAPQLLWQAFLTPFPWKRRVGLATAFGPWLPQHYRLRGPNACPEEAGKAIVKSTKVLMGWKFDLLVIIVDLIHLFIWSVTLMRLARWVI